MKPPPFSYARPLTVDRALEIKLEYGDGARFLAGGQSLLPLLNFRLAAPEVLIDIGRIDALGQVTKTDGGYRIGSTVTQRSVETSAELAEGIPLLRAALRLVGHVQNRSRGTIGGSIAHADPAAELPAICVALDAVITARSPDGARAIPASDFFSGPYETALEPNEIVESVWLPATGEGRGAIRELSPRHGDFAVAGVTGTVRIAQGVVQSAGLALFGVAPTPVRLTALEELLIGNSLDDDLLATAADLAASAAATGFGDIHASSAYRSRVAGELTRRALVEMTS